MLEVKIKKRLANFTLDVEFCAENEVFALLGASGCGKSMTLKCIAGIEQPDEGYIRLNGHTLFDSFTKVNLVPQKRKVGYMFQDYALFPHMSVEQNIMAGMGKRPDKALVKEYLRQFHLEELQAMYPVQLSGGQKQRVAMARMLAAGPDVILLDEPFSALDSHLKWELEQQMRQILQNVNKTTLYVSHNRDEVYRMSSVVGCLNQGKMEVVEPVKEFFKNPKTRTAAELSGCKNISDVKVTKHVKDREIGSDLYVFEAIEWGVTLSFTQCPKDTSAIGIRAHYLYPEYEKIQAPNLLQVMEYQVIEDTFEWIVLFKACSGGGWLQWKQAKSHTGEELKVPSYFRIEEKDILFLQN